MDLSTLSSLPDRQWRTGIAEVIKYGLMADRALFERLERIDLRALKKNVGMQGFFVGRSAAIKAGVVSKDERETRGLRETLNLGHTFGHAIESVTRYRAYTHGEAIAIGMCAAARLGALLGSFPADAVRRVDRLFERWGLPTRMLRRPSRPRILAAMARDKKTVNGGFRFIVPLGIGGAKVAEAVPLRLVARVLEEVGA
jgi:3-dehydroquinate synthase